MLKKQKPHPLRNSIGFDLLEAITNCFYLVEFIPKQVTNFLVIDAIILFMLSAWCVIWYYYIFLKISKGYSHILLAMASIISYIFSSILYLPSLGVLLSSLKIEDDENGTQYPAIDNSIKYLSTEHIPTFIISIPAIILLVTGSTLYKIFAFNPSLSFTESSACLSPFPAIIFHFVRTGLVLISVFGSYIHSQAFISIIVMMIMISYYWYRFNAIDIYNTERNFWALSIISLGVWISVINVVGCYFSDKFSGAGIGGILFGGVIVISFVFSEHQGKIFDLITKTTNETDKIKLCVAMVSLIKYENK